MVNKFLSLSIRTHLIILLLVLAIPSAGLIVRSGIAKRDEAIEEGKKECLRLVDSIAAEQQAVVAGVQQLVTALALLPQVQSHNRKATNTILSELLKKNPHYANIGIADKSGLFWASATPFEGKLSVADRKYYQDAVRTGLFSSGEYTIARTVKRPVMNFGYPVKNASNELISVIVVGLDLDYAQRNFEKINLPTGASFSLLDHQGIVLIRNLKDTLSERLVGRHMRKERFAMIKEGPNEGTSEGIGNDGRFRLAAHKKMSLPHESKPYLYVVSSMPLDSITSPANAAMLKNVSLLVLLFGVGLFLIWLIGNRIIVKPIMVLKKASEQLGLRADTVNVSDVVKSGELGELARTFDGMVGSLAQREAALRESEQRWATTVGSIGDAVMATDLEGRITFLNPVAVTLTGWKSEEALGQPIVSVFRIVNEKTRQPAEELVAQVLSQKRMIVLANDTALVAKDGSEIPIEDSAAPIFDATGNVTGAVLVFHDVTAKRRAQAELREALNRALWLARLPEQNPNPVIRARADGTVLYCNPACAKLHGWKSEVGQLLPKELFPLISRAMTEGSVQEDVQLNGRIYIIWVEPFPGEGYANIYARDITERKRLEEELRDHVGLLDDVIDGSTSPIFLKGKEGKFITINAALERMLGKSRQELKGKTDYDIAPKELADYWRSHDARVMATGKAIQIEEIADLPDGHHIFLANKFPLVNAHGQVYGVGAISHDITERKQAEEALQASERRFRSVLENMSEGLMLFDPQGNLIYQNPASLRVHGFEEGQDGTLGKDQVPVMWQAWDESGRPVAFKQWPISRVFRGERFQGQILRVLRPDTGFEFYGSYNGCPINGPDGKLALGFITIRDVTQQHQAEEALRASERKYRNLFENIEEMVTVYEVERDDGGRIVERRLRDANPAFLRAVGVSSVNQIRGKTSSQIFGKVWSESHLPAVQEAMDTGQVQMQEVYRPESDRHYISSVVRLDKHTYLGTGRDITERKKAEEAVQKNKERFEILSETASRLLATDEPQKLVNELCRNVITFLGCHAFFNYLVDEEKGCLHLNAYAGIPEETGKEIEWLDYGVAVCGCAARDACRIVAEDIPNTPDVRTELVKSFGIKAYACHPLFSAGRVMGTLSFGTRSRTTFTEEELLLMKTVADQVAVAMERMRLIEALKKSRDELEMRVQERTEELQAINEELRAENDERLRIEIELRESESRLRELSTALLNAQERERKLIAGEIHDSMGASLAAIKFKVESVLNEMGDGNPQTRVALESVLPIIQETIDEARRIQQDLRPSVLDDLGILAAINWFCRQFESTYSNIHIKKEIDIQEHEVPESLKIVIYRVLQEALNNIAKHSKASLVLFSLQKAKQGIRLVVRDSGQGFDLEEASSRKGAAKGLGLDSMRERTELSGGSFSIESRNGAGTVIRAAWPIEQPSS